MIILGIESSCDDTSIALVEATKTGFVVIAEKTASQIDVHKKYGGVVPEIAGRCHAENILPLVETILENNPKPEVIAVTAGPGLMTGLLIGVEVAKSLSYLLDIPIVKINHIEGHMHSVGLQQKNFKLNFPTLALTVSGGHTELILMKDYGDYELVGKTQDDAAGECFDKVAKLIGFEYPGGPKISEFAKTGNPKAIKFPRPMLNSDNFNFSFSGLKTSALYWLKKNITKKDGMCYVLRDTCLKDFCASFEQAIIDVLVKKTIKATKKYNIKTIILAGGVSANPNLRETLEETIKSELPEITLHLPDLKYSMDNAAMIAVTAYHHAKKQNFTTWQELEADPNWKVYN